jgi:hypothetical protein
MAESDPINFPEWQGERRTFNVYFAERARRPAFRRTRLCLTSAR